MKTQNMNTTVWLVAAVTFVVLLLAGSASAQWSGSTNIYYNSGNVGIGTNGTNGPSQKLHVYDSTGGDLMAYFQNAGSGRAVIRLDSGSGSTTDIRLAQGGSDKWSMIASGGAAFLIRDETASAYRMMIESSGNVGIGTTSPSDDLQVGGTGNHGIQIGSGYAIGIKDVFVGGIGARMELGEYLNSSTFTPRMSIIGGNVGIGTTNPEVKLEVSGGFKATGMWDMPSSSYFRGNAAAGYRFNNAADTLNLMRILDNGNVLIENGNVGIGKSNPTVALDVIGSINLTGTINAKYQDVAEWVPSSEQIPTGTVVVLDPTKSNQVISSTQAYDMRVAGVVSERPGIALGESGTGKVLVATTGRVLVKVDASKDPIHIGDLLVTSDIPGLAMKSKPITIANRKMHTPGTLIGKALEPLESGSGKILVLLSLQ